ncbi:uncharacterized protein LOC131076811 [Cryptomeria japonica]|uniref:uncharacterized protein LOC131076811 n=1 Tax=Cryptomeria japonica TaxID=3369 RepID=UPI0025AD29B3|nr:uncharacterized protein LOC131076811 [Cryptomeria japonica]
MWGWCVGVEDPRSTTQYSVWWIQHKHIPLTNLIVPIGAQQIRHGRDPKGKGRGGGRYGGGRDGGGRGGVGRGGGGIDLIAMVVEQVDSGEEDVDISGEIASMSSSDEGDESGSGSSSNDGDEGGDDGHDVEMPQDTEFGGAERGDEEGLRDQFKRLEDLVATLW